MKGASSGNGGGYVRKPSMSVYTIHAGLKRP